MIRSLVPGLVAALTILVAARADDPDPEPPVRDRAILMRGSWELSAIEIGGMKMNIGALGAKGSMTMTFEKDGLTSTSMGMTKKGTWKIDPRKNPRTIDLTDKSDNKTTLGIYKLEKNELIVAFAQPGQPRPRDFKNQQNAIIILTRVKKK
jgi:uncharacterized protein (TIGR03067 family)